MYKRQTLFNALTGSNQFVGNWPGVTVEKKEGKLKKHDDVVIMDLPAVSYTHLDVYKRQALHRAVAAHGDAAQRIERLALLLFEDRRALSLIPI